METPRSVTVLRDSPGIPEASALCMFLGLLGVECHQHDLAEAVAGTPADGPLGLAAHLSRSPLVIALSSDAVPPTRLVHTVNRLRCNGRLNWDGAFLAVVGEYGERSALLKTDLLGDSQNRFPFGGIPGHAAIFRPVLIAELLRQLAALREIGSHAWATLLHQADAWKVRAMTREAESLIAAGDAPAAAAMLGEVISLAKSISWLPLLLDWHQDFSLVQEMLRELLSAPSPSAGMGTHELTPIVLRVKQILSKTCIGDY